MTEKDNQQDTQKIRGRFQTRPQRVALHEQRDKMTVANRDPDYAYRWVNDVEDRVDRFKLGGYILENDPKQIGDSATEQGINRTSSITEKFVGNKTKAVLMKIHKDLYEADQLAKQKVVDESDAAMKRDAEQSSDYGSLKVSRKR